MKECPYCSRPLDDAAVVCKRCGTHCTDGLNVPRQALPVEPLPSMRGIGRAYGIVTGALVLTTYLSGVCWTYSTSTRLHDACLFVWVLAGLLLTASQIVFIVLAARTKASDARFVVLFVASILLVMIGLAVFGLANMPS